MFIFLGLVVVNMWIVDNDLYSALHRSVYKQDPKEKGKLQRSLKLMFIFLEAFNNPFVPAVEAASQSSLGTKVKLYKVEAADEGLLLGESAEYTASQGHQPTLVPTTHPSFPPSATRAILRFLPKIIFLEINRINNIIT
jgi:hypothetical protein